MIDVNKTKSAGGVVVNSYDEVLIVSQGGESWSLPKGHIESGESDEEAARREILEESGVAKVNLIKRLGEYERFRIGKGGTGEDASELKKIVVFLFTTDHDKLQPIDPHNPECRWVIKDKVAESLTHPKDKEFFLGIKDII